MNGIRCAIFDGQFPLIRREIHRLYNPPRIFGSHSEAKRELRHWIDEYPDARIVDEGDL